MAMMAGHEKEISSEEIQASAPQVCRQLSRGRETQAQFLRDQRPSERILRFQKRGVAEVRHRRFAVQFAVARGGRRVRSEEHTSELQSQSNLVCRLLLEKKKLKGIGTLTPMT